MALVPSSFTSIVSPARFEAADIWLDHRERVLYKYNGISKSVWVKLSRCDSHYLIVERSRPIASSSKHSYCVAAVRKQKIRPSTAPLPPRSLTGLQAHILLGHPGPEPLSHLSANVDGISPLISDPPSTTECSQCSANKARQIISRRSDREHPPTRPFQHLAIDLIELECRTLSGDRYIFHAYCLFSKYSFVYSLKSKDQDDLFSTFKTLDRYIRRHFRVSPLFVLLDGERGYGFEAVTDSLANYCSDNGILLQVRSPHTPDQSGHAERSGQILIVISRSLAVTSGVPPYLYHEVYFFANYLHNRTPVKALGWKTPHELVYDRKPSLAHLRMFGCRAYALRKVIKRTDKLSPRALIGYLVGIDSRNIFRIWLPGASSRGHLGKVIRTRDVTFDESLFYGSADDGELLRGIDLSTLIQDIELPDDTDVDVASSEDETEESDPTPNTLVQTPSTTSVLAKDAASHPHSLNPYPSPVSVDSSLLHSTSSSRTPRARSPTMVVPSRKRTYRTNTHLDDSNVISKRTRSSQTIAAYWTSFVAGTTLTPKARIHRSQLPDPPRFWNELLKLPPTHRQGFMTACRVELDTIARKETYVEIPVDSVDTRELEILPLMWVWTYKFESDYLLKYKARLVVRGDLQTTAEDTHAATLAIQIFRCLMAIAAYFNLEIRQYDVVGAFTNAHLPKPVYCTQPEGFGDRSTIWELRRALYGLKTSPILWYNDFTATLRSLGFRPILDTTCLWTNDRVIIFFYVDDIIIMARPGYSAALEDIESKLMKSYEITSLQDRKSSTFCSITYYRDRDEGDIWLSQKDYCNMIYHKYPAPRPWTKCPPGPLPSVELVPSTETKNEDNCRRYAQIVGSIGYAAGATRLEVAKPHSKLAEFLQNPGEKHFAAAYQCLAWLYYTQDVCIHYSANKPTHHSAFKEFSELDFFGATDASYGDHKATRRSTLAYIFLFAGSYVGGKSTLSRSVAKSTTEAELLAASAGGTELIWWLRMLEDLGLTFDHEPTFFCDNQQTIGLLTKDQPRLKTTLRHVDIHHHWLREKTQNGELFPRYVPTAVQPADGLTKMLTKQRLQDWMKLIGLEVPPFWVKPTETPSNA